MFSLYFPYAHTIQQSRVIASAFKGRAYGRTYGSGLFGEAAHGVASASLLCFRYASSTECTSDSSKQSSRLTVTCHCAEAFGKHDPIGARKILQAPSQASSSGRAPNPLKGTVPNHTISDCFQNTKPSSMTRFGAVQAAVSCCLSISS